MRASQLTSKTRIVIELRRGEIGDRGHTALDPREDSDAGDGQGKCNPERRDGRVKQTNERGRDEQAAGHRGHDAQQDARHETTPAEVFRADGCRQDAFGCSAFGHRPVGYQVMTDLLIATTNAGKIREIVPILQGTSVRLLTLGDLPSAPPEPEETGASFAQNARLKADYYAEKTGLITVAEDSGLVIDALDGRPGIHSARYPGATYADKFANLYKELAPFPRPWKARYFCSLRLTVPAAVKAESHEGFACLGVVLGEIAPEPRGTQGFGYDPIFFYPEFNATFGEVDDERKAAVAHRGKAFRKLREYLVLHPL